MTAVTPAKNPISFSTLKGNVDKFHQIVTSPKMTVNPQKVPQFIRQLEGMIGSFSGDKSNFLPLLYKFNLARRHVAKFLPKNAPQIFLPDYSKKELEAIATKIGSPPVVKPALCWTQLVTGIQRQAIRLVIGLTPTPKNIQIFNEHQKAFKGLETPMQFAIHNALCKLERPFTKKNISRLDAFHQMFGPVLREQLNLHPQLKARYHAILLKALKISNNSVPDFILDAIEKMKKVVRSQDLHTVFLEYSAFQEMCGPAFEKVLEKNPPIKTMHEAILKKFFLRLGIVAAGAIGNTAIAYNYGFFASMITGVATQALLNYRTISKAGLKAGAIQGLAAYSLSWIIWSGWRVGSAIGSALRSIELPEIPIVSPIVNAKIPIVGTDSHIGTGTATILAVNLFQTVKAIRDRNTVGVLSGVIGLPLTAWFGMQSNQPLPATN